MCFAAQVQSTVLKHQLSDANCFWASPEPQQRWGEYLGTGHAGEGEFLCSELPGIVALFQEDQCKQQSLDF